MAAGRIGPRPHGKCFPKNPTSPPTVTNPPRTVIDLPCTVIDPPINVKNPTLNVTRPRWHFEARGALKRPNLTPFLASRFSPVRECTNTPNSTQTQAQQNQPVTADFLDNFALIAASKNCSTWNNLRFRAKTAQIPAKKSLPGIFYPLAKWASISSRVLPLVSGKKSAATRK